MGEIEKEKEKKVTRPKMFGNDFKLTINKYGLV